MMAKMTEVGLTVWQAAALKCLDHAARRDAEKGGDGTRTSRDVGDCVGIHTDQARDVLWALADSDLVDVFDTSPLEWRITDAGRAALAESEPKP